MPDIEHETDDAGNCVCGPQVIPVKREDGSVGYVYVHHVLQVDDGNPSD